MRLLFLSAVFMLCLPLIKITAQVSVQNNGVAFISTSSDILFINGTYTNASTAALTNNGSLYISQDLTNYQAAMATGTGTLYLNGSSTQAVAGNQMFKTFNLNTNNASGITLNNDLSIGGAHTYVAGIITSSSTPNYLIYQAGSSYSGDADSKHVNGWVKKFGNTGFTFPVGDASLERTIAIASLSVSSEFNAHYYTTTPNTTQLLSPLISLDAAEYWALAKVSGGSASVPMNWDNNKVAFPNWVLSDIRVANYNGSLWTDQGGSATGNVATTGNITSNSISSFNLFTFASRSYVVPLTLINFTANKKDDYVQIGWVTDNEFNVNHFTVERSDDGVNFYAIAQMPGRNRGVTETYTLNDKKAINGIVYYRLRSIDIDGKEKLSSIVTLRENNGISQLSLVTNPVQDQIRLKAGSQLSGLFDYRLTTASGQFVQQGKFTIVNGSNTQFSLGQNIKPGTYLLLVNGGEKLFSFKVIVEGR